MSLLDTVDFSTVPAMTLWMPRHSARRRLRELGKIDSESIQFLTAQDSPTGKAAVIFAGAYSGTTSLWEFTCKDGTEGGADGKGDGTKSSSAARVLAAKCAFAFALLFLML
jgi:hypothetical protein